MTTKDAAEKTVRDIRRKTRKPYSAEEKIRIALEDLRGEESIAESLYYSWSKDFLEADKKRLAGDTAIKERRKRIKKQTIQKRRLNHQQQAA